jgi:hypothetical protein
LSKTPEYQNGRFESKNNREVRKVFLEIVWNQGLVNPQKIRGRGYGPGLSYTLSIRNFFNTTEMDFVEDSRISKRQIRVKRKYENI